MRFYTHVSKYLPRKRTFLLNVLILILIGMKNSSKKYELYIARRKVLIFSFIYTVAKSTNIQNWTSIYTTHTGQQLKPTNVYVKFSQLLNNLISGAQENTEKDMQESKRNVLVMKWNEKDDKKIGEKSTVLQHFDIPFAYCICFILFIHLLVCIAIHYV